MAFTVLRVPEVRRTVENELTKRERRAYDAAVDALRGEGCRAGGKRLAASDSGDYPMCQCSLFGAWRLVTVYLRDRSILIDAVTQHTETETPSSKLAKSFPGLAVTGRRRSDQPPCCEDPDAPPALTQDLEETLFSAFVL